MSQSYVRSAVLNLCAETSHTFGLARSRILVRMSRTTVIGPFRISLIEFQAHSSTRRLSHPGPPLSMVVTHQWTARRYGAARSIEDAPAQASSGAGGGDEEVGGRVAEDAVSANADGPDEPEHGHSPFKGFGDKNLKGPPVACGVVIPSRGATAPI